MPEWSPERRALALDLDGEALAMLDALEDAYSFASRLLGDQFAWASAWMSTRGPGRVVAVGSQFDPVRRLLRATGIPHVAVAVPEAISGFPDILFLGCLSSSSPEGAETIARLLDAGTIVVSSDKSATIAGLRDVLRPGSPQPPTRCLLDINPRLLCDHSRSAVAPLAGLSSVVRLSAGSVPIAPVVSGVHNWVVASDAQTGAPISVVVQIGRGHLIHSVPHWWQADDNAMTALDQRLARDISGLRSVASGDSIATFGQVSAAAGMLSILSAALRVAAGSVVHDDEMIAE
jgi:hypothetical protein